MKSIRLLTLFRENFSTRIFVFVTLFILVISVCFTSFFYLQQRTSLEEGLKSEGALLASLLAFNTKVGVFAENSDLLKDPVDGVLQHKEVLNALIVSPEGRVLHQVNGAFYQQNNVSHENWQNELEYLKKNESPHTIEKQDHIIFWAPVTSSLSYGTTESLLFNTPSPETSRPIGFVRLTVDKSPLKKKLQGLLYSSVFLAAAFLLLGSIASYFIVKGITRPLNRLTQRVKELEGGHPFKPVTIETRDEIGKLAHAFNHLAETLQTRDSEKAELTEQLQQAQKREAIGTLAGGVAHDFNNILTAIIGFGTLMQQSLQKDSPYRIYSEQILNAADRATVLVQRLLSFSRKQTINPKPADINELIKGIQSMLSRLIGEDIDFRVSLTSQKLVALVDAGQIDQILINLATNARDAMPGGGILTISSSYVDGNTELLLPFTDKRAETYGVIIISDTGTGIDDEIKAKVYDPFFTTKEVGKGTGLGLSMVYGIVKQHDGFIQLDSRPGHGTTFTIYLPLIGGQPDRLSPVQPALISGNRETILIAEDDRSVRKLAKHILERQGYHVIEAENGEQALSCFKMNLERIDLVLLDVVMPKMNGQVVYDEIHKLRPDVKTLFMSGYTNDIISEKGIQDQELNFIAKPVKPDELLAKVRDILR